MKLSRAQLAILKYMGNGAIYYRVWRHWATKESDSVGPTVNIRSMFKLERLGLIQCHGDDWRSKYYRITDAGREALGEGR
jgi:DNA-binding PadR family transcriptional regulator